MTLIYILDPNILKMYLRTKNKRSRSRLSIKSYSTALRTDRRDRAHYHAAFADGKNRLRLAGDTVRYRLPHFYGPPCIRALCNAFCIQEESVRSHKSKLSHSAPRELHGGVRALSGRAGVAGRAAARGAASRRACVPSGRYVDRASRRSTENNGKPSTRHNRTQNSGVRLLDFFLRS